MTRGQAAAELARRRLARLTYRMWVAVAQPGVPLAKHHEALADLLQRIEDGEISRAMIFMPPGSAKSTYASVLFPPHYLGRFPDKCIITASYGQRLSRRFGKRARNLVRSKVFRRIFGFGLARDGGASDEWQVGGPDAGTRSDGAGEYTATSVDGSVTGRRADCILVDDPVKGRREADSLIYRETAWSWWLSDLRTRLKPGGAIALIMTRWHEDDIAGRILPPDYDGQSGWITARDGERWYVLSIRAQAEADDPLGRKPGEWLWPEWFVPGMLEQEKRIQGPRNWNALYQQRPSPEDGDFFKREWLRWYDAPPPRATLKIYGASDYAVTAEGGDWTVHLVVGVDPDDNIYILDLWRAQTTTDEWVEAFIDLCQKWKPLQWAEERGQIVGSVGPFLAKRLRERQCYLYREQFISAVDKATRAQAIRGRMAMGKVLLPRSAPRPEPAQPGDPLPSTVADMMPAFVSELMSFPTGVHDDQVDAFGLIGRLLDKMVTGQKQQRPEDMRGLSDMTMDEAWEKLIPKRPDRTRI